VLCIPEGLSRTQKFSRRSVESLTAYGRSAPSSLPRSAGEAQGASPSRAASCAQWRELPLADKLPVDPTRSVPCGQRRRAWPPAVATRSFGPLRLDRASSQRQLWQRGPVVPSPALSRGQRSLGSASKIVFTCAHVAFFQRPVGPGRSFHWPFHPRRDSRPWPLFHMRCGPLASELFPSQWSLYPPR
jgi:hypothetical protein